MHDKGFLYLKGKQNKFIDQKKKKFHNFRIVVIIPLFPHVVQPYIFNQILWLKNNGAKILIVASKPGESINKNEMMQEKLIIDTIVYQNLNSIRNFAIEFMYYCYKLLKGGKVRKNLVKIWKSNIILNYGIKYFLKSIVRFGTINTTKYDVVHTHFFSSAYEWLVAKTVFGSKIILTFHGLTPPYIKDISLKKIQHVLNTCDIILANTKFAMRQLIALGCPIGKIKILPQGIDLKNFSFIKRRPEKKRKIIFLSVGRLSVEKGFEYALRAMANLTSSFDFQYRICGSGPQLIKLKQLATELSIGNRIKFFGPMSQKDLFYEYSSADIFILPSIKIHNGWQETQGVVIQEAQATGLPVIATRTGGIPECIIDGKTGILVDEKSPEQIADAIKFLINHPEKYRELSFAGRKYVEEHFDINKICERLLDIYKEVTVEGSSL